MLVIVPTFREEFKSLVESGFLWAKEDVLLLTDTEPANSWDGIEGCSSFHYLPFDIVEGVVPDERPDIFTGVGAVCSSFLVFMLFMWLLYRVIIGL